MTPSQVVQPSRRANANPGIPADSYDLLQESPWQK